MSHEGIRFVDKEHAGREVQNTRPLSRIAVTPAKVRVLLTEGKGLEIDWADGHRSTWAFAWLRDACPCATCHEERGATGRKPGEPKPQLATLLQMYKAPPRPESVSPVGRYAISFHWNDGHQSGIYSWDYLRRHCQCGPCLLAESR